MCINPGVWDGESVSQSGFMYVGREIRTRPDWILYGITRDFICLRFSKVRRPSLFNMVVILLV